MDLTTYIQQAALLKVFPEFVHQSKPDRELQLKVINDKFDVVDWYHPGTDAEHMKQYPFEFYDSEYEHRSWFVVRFSGIKLRARLIHKIPDTYCAIIQSSSNPILYFYNQMIDEERWFNDETLTQYSRFDHAWHPHISGSEPCTGAHSRHFARTAADGSIIGYLAAIRNFLSSWNNNSRFWNLNGYRAFTGKYARKAVISAYDMSYILTTVGGLRNVPRSVNFQYQTVPKLFMILVEKQGAFPKEACCIMRLLAKALSSSDSRTVAEHLVRETQEQEDYGVLNYWYNNSWKHRNERFSEDDSNHMRNVYYNYQDFLYDRIISYVRAEIDESAAVDNDKLEEFAEMAFKLWNDYGGFSGYTTGAMDTRDVQKTMRLFFGVDVELTYEDVYKALNPEELYGENWGHELVMSINRNAKLQCCMAAYERFGKRQKEIANEINTLQDNSTENRVFQQILQF